ncbi:MAG: hypothetical protein J3R72DRAFT_439835 [Linnemannia gamsii]|nr:MAG: hypothetical protein J3R72DRAFT_439835 [Linnemannia gamsii]
MKAPLPSFSHYFVLSAKVTRVVCVFCVLLCESCKIESPIFFHNPIALTYSTLGRSHVNKNNIPSLILSQNSFRSKGESKEGPLVFFFSLVLALVLWHSTILIDACNLFNLVFRLLFLFVFVFMNNHWRKSECQRG